MTVDGVYCIDCGRRNDGRVDFSEVTRDANDCTYLCEICVRGVTCVHYVTGFCTHCCLTDTLMFVEYVCIRVFARLTVQRQIVLARLHESRIQLCPRSPDYGEALTTDGTVTTLHIRV